MAFFSSSQPAGNVQDYFTTDYFTTSILGII